MAKGEQIEYRKLFLDGTPDGQELSIVLGGFARGRACNTSIAFFTTG